MLFISISNKECKIATALCSRNIQPPSCKRFKVAFSCFGWYICSNLSCYWVIVVHLETRWTSRSHGGRIKVTNLHLEPRLGFGILIRNGEFNTLTILDSLVESLGSCVKRRNFFHTQVSGLII